MAITDRGYGSQHHAEELEIDGNLSGRPVRRMDSRKTFATSLSIDSIMVVDYASVEVSVFAGFSCIDSMNLLTSLTL